MTFGFPAYHQQTIVQVGAVERVERALHRLGWIVSSYESGVWAAHTAVHFWSWGEKIDILVEDFDTLELHSRCRLVTQCFDWDINKRNVDRFASTLAEV